MTALASSQCVIREAHGGASGADDMAGTDVGLQAIEAFAARVMIIAPPTRVV
jgi:hypothetical protein